MQKIWRGRKEGFLSGLILAIFLLVLIFGVQERKALSREKRERQKKKELIVCFKESPSPEVYKKLGGFGKVQIKKLGGKSWLISFSSEKEKRKSIERLKELPEVECVEENKPFKLAFTPNDPYFPYQWHLKQIGMESAWSESTGTPSVVVAIIDSGVAYENYGIYRRAPDLGGTNFVPGYDFVNNDSHPNDDNGHGTHIAGTIAQTTDNGIGTAGIAFNCSIMPLKAFDESGTAWLDEVVEAFYWAADNGADVINCSFYSTSHSEALHEAVRYAYNKGVIIIAATGNDGSDSLGFPAAYSEVISVGSVGYDKTIASYSNCGTELDFVAPGGSGEISFKVGSQSVSDFVYQETFDPPNYSRFFIYGIAGTSQATAHVSGLVALLLSHGLESDEIYSFLREGAQDLGTTGYDLTYGWGLIQADKSLSDLFEPNDSTPSAYGPIFYDYSYYSYLTTQTDVDYFLIQANASGSLKVTLSQIPSGANYDLELYNSSGSLVGSSTQSGNKAESLEVNVSSGNYYLKIYSVSGSSDEKPYCLRVEGSAGASVSRQFGFSRIETAVDISQRTFPSGSNYVILATGYNFPDALAGAPLAYSYNAPLLLTSFHSLPDVVKDEIKRLGASKAIILGGTLAVSASVESELKSMGLSVTRISGANRFETAVKIAEKLKQREGNPGKVVIATGYDFPDALSASPLAAAKNYPILLVKTTSIPSETKSFLQSLPSSSRSALIMGGTLAVSSSVESEIKSLGYSVTRISGANRYDTAKQMATYAVSNGFSYSVTLMATGANFPDALAGGILGAKSQGPLLLTKFEELSSETQSLLEAHRSEVDELVLLGGPTVIGESLEYYLRSFLIE